MATPPVYTADQVVRFEADERLDLVDALALARNYEGALATLLKLMAEPASDGRVFFGCEVINPVTAFTLVLNSAAGLAVDTDGRAIFKPDGQSQSITLTGSATNYVYLYYTEEDSTPNNRRFYASPTTEDTTSINTRVSRKWGVHVHAPDNNAPSRSGLIATAVVNTVTVKLVPIAACSVNAGGTVSNLTDCRRLYNVDKNTFATEGDTFATTDAEVSGPFTLFRNITAAIKTMLGTANWRTLTGIGTLAEVFTARGGQASLNARFVADEATITADHNEILTAREGRVSLSASIAAQDDIAVAEAASYTDGVLAFSGWTAVPFNTALWTGTLQYFLNAQGFVHLSGFFTYGGSTVSGVTTVTIVRAVEMPHYGLPSEIRYRAGVLQQGSFPCFQNSMGLTQVPGGSGLLQAIVDSELRISLLQYQTLYSGALVSFEAVYPAQTTVP